MDDKDIADNLIEPGPNLRELAVFLVIVIILVAIGWAILF